MERGIIDIIMGIAAQNSDNRGRNDRGDRGNNRGEARDSVLNRELNPVVLGKLRTHLKGLRIAYTIPGTSASKKVYKCVDLEESAINSKFSHEGTMVSVQQYFYTKYNYQIRHMHMPCLKFGNTNNSTFALPAELCCVVGGQVSTYT